MCTKMSPWVGKAMDHRADHRRRNAMLDEWEKYKWLQVGTSAALTDDDHAGKQREKNRARLTDG